MAICETSPTIRSDGGRIRRAVCVIVFLRGCAKAVASTGRTGALALRRVGSPVELCVEFRT